jgi:hypothetical protein
MPDPEFTEDEIDALRRRLDELELDPHEKELLAFACLTAKDQASQEKETVVAKSLLINLHKQFARAFSPSGKKSAVIFEAKIRIKPPPPG